jgi:hypothetical protein
VNRGWSKTTWILACAVALTFVACGGEETVGSGRETEFAAVLEQKAALDAKRDEITALEEQMAAADEMAEPAEGEAAEGEAAESEEAMPAVDYEAQLAQMNSEVIELSDNFMTALVMFLNSADMVADEAPTGLDLDAIRLKSGEDMLIAQEYIDQGGDYRRSLEILDTSLVLDPDNPELQAAREKADSDQFMTLERFEIVSKGMSQAEVQARLGTPNPHNVRDYPEKNVIAWFYRREDKGAAGVWFEEKDGVMTAYRTEFDAIKANEESQ